MSDTTATAPPGGRFPIHALLLLALFLAEAVIFYVHVVNDVTPYYPPNFDQLSYYLATYDLINDYHAKGWTAFVTEFLLPSQATGTTFVLQGALLSLVGGANRTTLLSVNLLYFLAMQVAFFHTVRSRTGDIFIAWFGIALLLSLGTLFSDFGSIYDYRIDFSALCLYGIWTCLIVWSGTFRHTGRSLIVAIAGILLIYARFFTIIYVAGISGGLLVAMLYVASRSRSRYRRALARRRMRNVLISGTIVAVICLFRLFLSRDAIYAYYVVGHVLGDEKYIRAHELGLYTIMDHLLFYPKSILDTHVGPLALRLSAALMASSLMAALWLGRLSPSELPQRVSRFRLEFVTLALAILIPMVILTINIAKSTVVGGIVVVPVVLALALFCAAMWSREEIRIAMPSWSERLSKTSARLLRAAWGVPPAAIVAAAVMAVGLNTFASKGLASDRLPLRADLERITQLAKTIASYALDEGLISPSMSSDRVVDYNNIGTPRLFSIETLHRNLEINPKFGHGLYGIFATSREDALRLFAESDIIVLTDAVTNRSTPYPMNTKIKEYWDELWQWTNQNRVLLLSTPIFGIQYRVFVRPLVKLDGTSEGWVTSAGLSVEVDPAWLVKSPYVVLEGKADFDLLGGEPHAQAALIEPTGKPSAELPAKLTRLGDSYRIIIDTRPAASPLGHPITIHVTFDRYFVPSKLGINADTRELVLRAPTKHELRSTLSD